MGVSLSSIVEGEKIEIEHLKGKKIAVDAFNTLYQFLSIIRDRMTGQPLRDSEGRVTSHLSGLLYRTTNLIENGITPIFVFDGEPPSFKKKTVEERNKIRENAEIRWKKALEEGRYEEARIAATASSKLTNEMIEESKELLNYMGVSYVQAPSEGEAQAAYMTKKGIVYASCSQDWDSLLFGAPLMIKNLAITGKRKIPRKERYVEIKPEMIKLNDVLSKLGITRDQLIIIGILTGTDYNPGGVEGIGAKTALRLVKEKNSLDLVMQDLKWKFEITPQEIFDFFKNPPVDDIEVRKTEFQPEKLKEMMVDVHNFSEERVNKVIEKLENIKKSGKQTGLGTFLGS